MKKRECTELDTTAAEWMAEMDGLQACNDPGETASEVAYKLEVYKGTALRYLGRLMDEGKCVKGLGTRIDSSGRKQRVAVYQLVKKTRTG